MPDLWPDFAEAKIDENNALKIIQEQAKSLGKKTKGKVKATFSKTQYKKIPINPDLEWVGGFPKLEIGYKNVEVLEQELEDKKNINSLFSTQEYKFEIYNDKYRFRLFKVDYNISYPIAMHLDQDIAKELHQESTQTIKNDLELEQQLSLVFSSKKLITIITRIMQNKAEIEISIEDVQRMRQISQDFKKEEQESKKLQS